MLNSTFDLILLICGKWVTSGEYGASKIHEVMGWKSRCYNGKRINLIMEYFVMIDHHLKSVLKALSWRIIATLTTMIISYFITHSLKFAVSIGSIEVASKVVLYYFHERIWNHVSIFRTLA